MRKTELGKAARVHEVGLDLQRADMEYTAM